MWPACVPQVAEGVSKARASPVPRAGRGLSVWEPGASNNTDTCWNMAPSNVLVLAYK